MSTQIWSFSASKLSAHRRDFLRRAWPKLAVIAGAAFGLGLLLWLLAPGVRVPLWAAAPLTFILCLAVSWDEMSGGYYLAAGIEAQRWTSRKLRSSAGRDGRVIDSVPFEYMDVDHVVLATVGVLAIETKYTDREIAMAPKDLELLSAWAAQASESAEKIRLFFLKRGVDVAPVVVVWGQHVRGLPHDHDGVRFVHGSDLPKLVLDTGSVLSRHLIAEMARDLTEYRAMRSEFELLQTS
jgi:hypothetical protein